MNPLLTIVCLLSITLASVPADTTSKPKLKVAADGYPSGHETPEGAACDLARAFINRDSALFSATCVRLYAGGKGPADYAEFIRLTADGIKAEAADKTGPPRGPKSIAKVFAARHLSKNGPASYGYAAFGFQDVMFVDVGVILHNDEQRAMNRTMVIRDTDGKWYVHPMPAVSPQLSKGLNNEEASVQDFSEVYELTM